MSLIKNYFKTITHDKITAWLFIALIVIGAFIRLYKFEGFSTFLGDQGRDAVIIKNIATFKEFVKEGAPSSIGGVRLGPGYYYLMAPFLLLFNFNPVGIAYGVFFIALIGLIAHYFIIKKEFHAYTALLFTFLCVFAYPFVDISRFAWNPNLAPMFSFLALYFTYKFLTRESVYDAIGLGVALSMATQMHHLTFILGIPIVIFSIYRLFTKGNELTFVRNTAIAIATFFTLYIPFIINELETNWENINALTNLFTDNTIVTENHPVFIRFLETTRYFLQNVFNIPELPTYSGLIFFIIFVGISLFALKKSQWNLLVALNASYATIYLVFFSLLNSARHPHYYNSIYLSVLFIITCAVSLIPQKNARWTVTGFISIAFLWVTIPKYYYFQVEPHNQYAKAKEVVKAFEGRKFQEPIRLAVLPGNETHDQYRYHLDLQGVNILRYSSKAGDPQELYVICMEAACDPMNDPGWPIESFYDKKLMDNWKAKVFDKEITIHRIIHDPEKQ